jgi:putative transposase
MGTYIQLLYQIVFNTKNRDKTLTANNHEELFKYLWGILKNKKCHLYHIGGDSDHLHIVPHMHPTISLASLVKDVKLASTEYIKSKNIFQKFSGWQEGYGAFTYSIHCKDELIE